MAFYVKPVSAFLTRDTQIFSNMDPYVVAVVGVQKQRSKTVRQGGKRPKWTNDVFTFRSKATRMTVSVYDSDTFSDDHVGTGEVDLSPYMGNNIQQQCNVQLFHKGTRAGTLKLLIRYVSDRPQQFGNSNPQIYGNVPQYGSPAPYLAPQQYTPPPQPSNSYGAGGGWGAQGNYSNQTWQTPTYNNNPTNTWGTTNPYGPSQNYFGPQSNSAQSGTDLWKNVMQATIKSNNPNQVNSGQSGSDLLKNVLQATVKNNIPNNPNNTWNNGWGAPNNGWGAPNNGWGAPNNGWGAPNNGWSSNNGW